MMLSQGMPVNVCDIFRIPIDMYAKNDKGCHTTTASTALLWQLWQPCGNLVATLWQLWQPCGNLVATLWQPYGICGNPVATLWQPCGNLVATLW